MDNRIELPGLESIRRGVNPLFVWLMIILVALFGAIGLKLPDPAGLIVEFVTAMTLIIGMPVLIWTLALQRYTLYQIDSAGLLIRGLFRGISIRWSDVHSVRMRPNGALQFLTATGSRTARLDNPYMMASAYQHLGRYLPASALDFGGAIEPFFAPMPGDLPAEVVWENPHPARLWPWYLRIGAGIIIFGVACFYSFLGHRRYLSSVWTSACGLAGLINTLMPDPRAVARRVEVSARGLIVDLPRGWRPIEWDSIRNAGYSKNGIHIMSSVSSFVIPQAGDDEAWDRFVRVLSYRLRTKSHPVLLPTVEQVESPIWAKWGYRHG